MKNMSREDNFIFNKKKFTYEVKTRPNEFGSMTARKGDIKPL